MSSIINTSVSKCWCKCYLVGCKPGIESSNLSRDSINKWKKTSFLIYVRLTRVLFYQERILKLGKKTRLNSRACQLDHNTRGLGKRQEVVQTNGTTLYLYVQQFLQFLVRVITNIMRTIRTFNVIESTGFSIYPNDRWFNNFFSGRVKKESNSQSGFRFFIIFCLILLKYLEEGL